MDYHYQTLHHLIPNGNAKARRHYISQDVPSSLDRKTGRLLPYISSSPDFSLDSVVPDMLAASPGPMTNMDDRRHHQPRKSSVTFDFSNLPTLRDYPDSTPSDSSDTHTSSDSDDDEVVVPSSPPLVRLSTPIPINGRILPADIQVALLDRDHDMRELVQRNDQFFTVLRHYLGDRGEGDWSRFERLLYLPREHLGDHEWIESLGEYLAGTPAYWCKFKELVGYNFDEVTESSGCRDMHMFGDPIEEEEEEEEEDDDDDVGSENDNIDTIGLVGIRDAPYKLVRLQEAYPLFFEGAKRALAGPVSSSPNSSRRGSKTEEEEASELDEIHARQEEREQDCEGNGESRLYREFVKTLMTSRREMGDEEWEAAIMDCLEGWPNLVAQLKEIVAYELGVGATRARLGIRQL